MATKEELAKLFGTTPEKNITNALIFEEPEKMEWQKATEDLNEGMNKTQTWAMCQALHPLLRSHEAVLVRMRSNGNMRPATELGRLFKQGTNKIDMSQALALILCVPANLQHYVDYLNDHQRELWRQLLSRLFITERQALSILNTSDLIVKEKSRDYYYYRETEKFTPPELMFFKSARYVSSTLQRYGYKQRETFITFPAVIYPYFIKVFCPETNHQEWFTREELPKDDYTVCNFEMDSVAKFPLIQGLLNAGKLPMKPKGVGMSDVKRVAKSLGLMEIFGDDAVKGSEQESLRARYYIEMIAQNYHNTSYSDKQKHPIESVLRRIFNEQFSRYSYFNFIPLLLPHIKGLRRQFTEENQLPNLLNDYLNLLRQHPDKWISIADALQQTYGDSKNSLIPFKAMVFDPESMSDFYEITNEFSKKIIGAESFVSEFGLAALQAFSLLLCSLGMAEVALSPLHRPESPFARAEFIRLTALGRFSLFITQQYDPPHIEQQAYFELDPDRLIIRSLARPNPYAQLLKDSSKAISKNRYETSASSFLAHCKNRTDVEKNISIFRQFISSDLPPLWKQFFDQLLQHCNPLTKDTTGYQHYHLSPDNTDLIRLITTDEKLRKLVIRAEDFRIMVKNSDLAKFEERLKAHGYLL